MRSSTFHSAAAILVLAMVAPLVMTTNARAEVRAWEGTITLPTYVWEEDSNPKFWAIEGSSKLSTTVKNSIIYPYTMQDHLLRTKVDRTYKALFLENEYLKITCLPELGGRLHSVFDKTEGKEMFHINHVIKPGMIGMRGAWISGGVEWNAGPQGHTVTIVSPVDALVGHNPDGSAYLEVSNQEKIFRTRWTARVTLHPGRAYLDEQIRLYNPTDGMHPYYFWNCTAFPDLPGTRFIYPMTLGTDHSAREFFRWPVHEGRDLSWLKNYDKYASIFAVDCQYDFFGAYDVDLNRGIVQVANHRDVGGKKAWTWGEWEFGKVSEGNLTDDDGAYIEVQSGPLPTQSDYGMLAPRDQVAWREWWYPVHGLGDGFEYATRDVAIQLATSNNDLTLRVLATARFPQAECVFSRQGKSLRSVRVDLGPEKPQVLTLAGGAAEPVDVEICTREGSVLAAFTTPLPIPHTEPPDPAKFVEKPDSELSAEQLYLKGRKFDRAIDRRHAREYYQKALAVDAGHVAALRSLAVLDFEAGLYSQALAGLAKALERDGDDGLAWYYVGVSQLQLGKLPAALDAAYHAARCTGTESLGRDLAGRIYLRQGDAAAAVAAFEQAVQANQNDPMATDHLMLAQHAAGNVKDAQRLADARIAENPTDPLPHIVRNLADEAALAGELRKIREFEGESDFELVEASLAFADLGLFREAAAILRAGCVEPVAAEQRSPLALYYLAHYTGQAGDAQGERTWLEQAAQANKAGEFASRAESVAVLESAIHQNPGDAQARLQLGNVLANLGRLPEAKPCWQKAAQLNAKLSIAWRNLALVAATQQEDPKQAEEYFQKAIAAAPNDQTLYRDLAELLVASKRRLEAIELLRSMPFQDVRRADVTVLLMQAYMDEKRYDDVLALLESIPYFVNWEGQDITWRTFNEAHIARGQQRLEQKAYQAALADFEAALTYPANLNVGRSNKPQEAPAQYWRGKALEALGRLEDARAAWKLGAEGADVAGKQNEYRDKCRAALGK